MAKFRCKLSGNIFTFVNDFDINDMLEHPQYELIEENDNGLQEEKQNTKEKVTKPRKTKEAK